MPIKVINPRLERGRGYVAPSGVGNLGLCVVRPPLGNNRLALRFNLLSALTFLTLATLLTTGCANSGHRLVLDPIGPSPLQTSAVGSDGALIVYSAFDAHAHFNGYPYRRYYTSYKIYLTDGELVRTVQNDNGHLSEGPATVTLRPGAYRVVARANGCGQVTVPVVIATHRVTTVRLDGGLPDTSALAKSNPVRLPDGDIVGWRNSNVAGHQ